MPGSATQCVTLLSMTCLFCKGSHDIMVVWSEQRCKGFVLHIFKSAKGSSLPRPILYKLNKEKWLNKIDTIYAMDKKVPTLPNTNKRNHTYVSKQRSTLSDIRSSMHSCSSAINCISLSSPCPICSHSSNVSGSTSAMVYKS